MLRLLLALCLLTAAQAQSQILQLRGSIVVAQVLQAAAPELKKDHNIEFRIITEGGSSPAIQSLAQEGVIDMALSTRIMTPEERAQQPSKEFFETSIGKQAIVLVVPDAIWNGGVQSLDKTQAVALYENDIKNWKRVGGPDRAVKFFHRDAEQGIWEVFALWGYGEIRKAPKPRGEFLKTPSDVLTTVEFNLGSISILEFGSLAAGRNIQALGIKLADGTIAKPDLATIGSGQYPITRPLSLITIDRPTGKLRDLIEFMTSEKGQVYVKQLGHITNAEIESAAK